MKRVSGVIVGASLLLAVITISPLLEGLETERTEYHHQVLYGAFNPEPARSDALYRPLSGIRQ